jgi:uroporphyrinogen decarboxylase
VRRITAAVRQHGLPIIFFPKGFGAGLQMLTPEDCDFVSIDWQTPLLVARHLVNPAIGLQGNMDPRILFAPQAVIEQHLQQYLAFFREHPNYIFNLGHGVHKDTPLENVQFVTEWFRQTQK